MSALVFDPNPQAAETCNRAIVVTGVGRSGTTIAGKLIHSMEDVEFVSDPPMLFSIVALLETLDRATWSLLYETYLCEEFLFSALAGRVLNGNTADETSIHSVKSAEWVAQRLGRSLRKREAEELLRRARVAYKMIDIAPFLPRLQGYYPGTRVVVVLRAAHDVFHSILERGWFSDQVLRTQNLSYPNRLVGELRVPYWVAPEAVESWAASDELHRIASYYLRVHAALAQVRNLHVVRYDELVESPRRVVEELAAALGLRWGAKTDELVGQVRRRDADRSRPVLDGLRPDVRRKVLECSRSAEARPGAARSRPGVPVG